MKAASHISVHTAGRYMRAAFFIDRMSDVVYNHNIPKKIGRDDT